MNKKFSITAKIWQWSGDMASWHFIYVPKDISEALREKFPKSPMIKCRYTIGETTWDSSMFRNNRENNYLIPVKQKVRKLEELLAGDEVVIQVEIL
jgi:hypothetical protein